MKIGLIFKKTSFVDVNSYKILLTTSTFDGKDLVGVTKTWRVLEETKTPTFYVFTFSHCRFLQKLPW